MSTPHTDPIGTRISRLPDTIHAFLAAHSARQIDTALSLTSDLRLLVWESEVESQAEG